jgi:hypothetical protein
MIFQKDFALMFSVIFVSSTTKIHEIYRAVHDGKANWGPGPAGVLGHKKSKMRETARSGGQLQEWRTKTAAGERLFTTCVSCCTVPAELEAVPCFC